METTLTTTIPDDTAANLQNGGATPLPRRLLELAVIKAYECNFIAEREAMTMLGFEDREELREFFKQYDVHDDHPNISDPNPIHHRALGEIGRRQEAILRKIESDCWPEEPDIPEAPVVSSVKEYLL